MNSNAVAPGCPRITVSTDYFAIFDAGGSLLGEVAYTFGKIVGQRHCALCDISHGWNPIGKSAWRANAQLGCGLQWLHRDEQSPAMAAYTQGKLPLVIARTDNTFTTLLDAPALARCGGDYDAFVAALGAAMAAASEKVQSQSGLAEAGLATSGSSS